MEEPQPNDLRQTLSYGIQSIWSHFEALTARAIGWWQSLDPQHKKLLERLGVTLVLLLVVLAVWKIPQRQLAPLKAKIQRERNSLQPQDRLKLEHDARKLENDARTALLQAVGGLVLLIGLYFTARTWRTTQEGQVTDRFTKAINQLGETGPEKLAIRLGGIYALERIARDSERDHWSIMEILTAYVREHAPWKGEEQISQEETLPSETPPTQNHRSPPKLAADIQAILTVVGRRTRTYGHGEDQQLNLSATDLHGADLWGAHLEGVWLSAAHLEGASLSDVHLEEAYLEGAHLERAELIGAHLTGAILWDAHLERASLVFAFLEADFSEAHLEGAALMGTHMERAALSAAHLEGATLWGAHLEGAELSAAHLEGAALIGTDLEGADLSGAHLEGATLIGADLKRAALMGAHLEGADLMEANLEGAMGLTVEQLARVKILYQAHLDPPLLEQIQQWYPHLLEKPQDKKARL